MSQTHKMKHSDRKIRILPMALAGLGLALSGCLQTPPKAPAVTTISETPPPIFDRTPGAYKVGKPYQVGSAWYYPKVDYGYRETGIASWYGPGFHGKATANGETFDQNALTAAHRTLPMPSMVRVTTLENGRSIKLRINDRGPFKNGRIIDLSRRAADLLGFRRQGTAKVRVEIVKDESRVIAAAALTADGAASAPDAAPRVPVAVQGLTQDVNGIAPATQAATPAASQTALAIARPAEPESQPEPQRMRLPTPEPDGIVTTVPVKASRIYVQAGSFTQITNANKLRARLIKIGKAKISPAVVERRRYFRVRFGPIGSVAEADRLLAILIDGGHGDARVVVD